MLSSPKSFSGVTVTPGEGSSLFFPLPAQESGTCVVVMCTSSPHQPLACVTSSGGRTFRKKTWSRKQDKGPAGSSAGGSGKEGGSGKSRERGPRGGDIRRGVRMCREINESCKRALEIHVNPLTLSDLLAGLCFPK